MRSSNSACPGRWRVPELEGGVGEAVAHQLDRLFEAVMVRVALDCAPPLLLEFANVDNLGHIVWQLNQFSDLRL